MNAVNKTLIASGLLLATLPAAQAQTQTAPPAEQLHERVAQMQVQIQRDVERSMAPLARMHAFNLAPEALLFAGRELEGERVVKGAPYCATAVHETVQALMDGNRIVKQQSTQLCRDGEGRTRREIQREGGQRSVYLHDPVAKESWVLYPDKKTARRLGGSFTLSSGSAPRSQMHLDMSERMRDHAERWREWAGQVAQRARESGKAAEVAAADAASAAAAAAKAAAKTANAGEPAVVVDVAVETQAPGSKQVQRNREVRVIRLSELSGMPGMPPLPPLPPTPPTPPSVGFGFGWGGVSLPRSGGASTALPAREIDGVKVDGERTSWTIEAGKIGNEKPIVISREVWRSPELMLTVQSKDSDPRSGEVSYRLEKLKRGEPDAALMKVPADYERGPVPKAPAAPAAPKAPKAAG